MVMVFSSILLMILFGLITIILLRNLSSFVLIVLSAVTSFTLGFLLICHDFVFAGATLIIVNSGAMAMVFLFVCILSGRHTSLKIVTTTISPILLTLYVVFVVILITSFLNFFNFSYFELSLKNDLLLHLLPGSSTDDVTVLSHLFLFEKNGNFFFLLIFFGFLLLITMCTAILVTKKKF